MAAPPTYEDALQIVRDFNELHEPSDEAPDSEYFRGQLELLADLFPHEGTATEVRVAEIEADLRSDKARRMWFVGLNADPPVRLRRFYTEREATEFVGTLEGCEQGLYYIDPPGED